MKQRKIWALASALVLCSCFSFKAQAQQIYPPGYNSYGAFVSACNSNPSLDPMCPNYVAPPPPPPPPSEPPFTTATSVFDPVGDSSTDSTQTQPEIELGGGINMSITGDVILPDGLPQALRRTLQRSQESEEEISDRVRLLPPAPASDAGGTVDTTEEPRSRRADTAAEEDSVLGRSTNNTALGLTASDNRPQDDTAPKKKDRKASSGAALGGGIDIRNLAISPQGYDLYSLMPLTNIPFYPPREVYRNNATVENRPALRSLTQGSDRLHREMIEQQYNNKK